MSHFSSWEILKTVPLSSHHLLVERQAAKEGKSKTFFLHDASTGNKRELSTSNDDSFTFGSFIVDWETELLNRMNPLTSSLKPIVHGVCALGSNMTLFSIDNKLEDKNDLILKSGHFNLGFVDGKLLTFGFKKLTLESRGNSKDVNLSVNNVTYPEDAMVSCVIPCENVDNRVFSLCGLFFNQQFHLFELKTQEFKSVPFEDRTLAKDVTLLKEFITKYSFTYYVEGKRVRSFGIGKGKCFELIFDGDKIVAIDTLNWMKMAFNNIISIGSHGLIINAVSNFVILKPAPFGKLWNESIIKVVASKGKYDCLWWDFKKDALFNAEYTEHGIYSQPVLSLDDIENAPTQVNPTLDTVERNFSFKCFEPTFKHEALEVYDEFDSFMKGFRGKSAYQFDVKRLKELEIVTGMNCKTKVPKMCSTNYVELNSVGDFADYIGAPIVYLDGDNMECGFIFDLVDNLRSSATHVSCGVFRERGKGMRSVNPSTSFLGILAPSGAGKTSVKELKTIIPSSWKKLFKNDQFQVTSGKVKVIDFTTDRDEEVAIVENVKDGAPGPLLNSFQRNTTFAKS